MRFVAYEAALAKVNKDGVSYRDELEASAKNGNPVAIAKLEPPDYPESLEYLRDWARELVGRSGVGMDGAAPLSWECLRAWSDVTGNRFTAEEASALMLLDGAMRHPDDVDRWTEAAEDPAPVETPAWPT